MNRWFAFLEGQIERVDVWLKPRPPYVMALFVVGTSLLFGVAFFGLVIGLTLVIQTFLP